MLNDSDSYVNTQTGCVDRKRLILTMDEVNLTDTLIAEIYQKCTYI